MGETMKIKRRFPNYFSGFEESEHEVNSLEELHEIEWIKSYKSITSHIGVFYSVGSSKGDYLMSLGRDSNNKIYYFVVGYIFGSGASLGLKEYSDYIKQNE